MKISDVSKKVDLPISTIRYYEKKGIIPETYMLRDEHNYRIYDERIVSYIKSLKTILSAGFSIHEIKNILSSKEIPREKQIEIVEEKINEIEELQKKLADSKHFLQDSINSAEDCTW
ncbi:MerR family transcriptional regulator [Paenibacillus sp. XY044]|uniref:helix-turn-helix domain-containing protein n=1 Tax=Paenibacillus sp. XY044 TaxID=2026089 RepID=UPI000B982F3D|nr:MerR family transcriptional regulator [Paenibacillus sp. XY044]OZB95338.1 hypothetical protein CJP46_16850 [Paenibacillus sp. XY044]